MSVDPQNRQFQQLNTFRKERTTVHVYLLSGTRFTGRIRSFDVHTLLLETQSGDMVIYGHAISTIEPAQITRARRPGTSPAARYSPESGAPPAPYRPAPPRSVMPGGNGATGRFAPPRGAMRPMPEPREDEGDGGGVSHRPSSAPSAPSVTIVRRRSRLVPKE